MSHISQQRHTLTVDLSGQVKHFLKGILVKQAQPIESCHVDQYQRNTKNRKQIGGCGPELVQKSPSPYLCL